MAEIRMPVTGGSAPQPPLNEITIYAKSSDKRLYVKDDTGVEVKLVTNESTLTNLVAQLPLTSTGGASPTIAINNVTTTNNGAMLATDKLKLDEATNAATADKLVKRDALGNASFNEVTAVAFNGPATTVQTIPALSGAVTSTGTNNATTLASNIVTNANVSPTAAIALTKLAVLPTDRANHIGSQLASTISDFGTAVNDHLTGTAPIVNAMIDASAGIELSKLDTDPLARANHTGTQTAATISDLTTEINNTVGTYLTANPITNAEIDVAAAIDLSKLATDPLDRANHTGTQLASTISDLNSAVITAFTEGNGIDITAGTISALGTTDRISVAGGTINIASNYIGQSSITTLGTVTTGTWNGSTLGLFYGGTGKTSPGAARNNLLSVSTVSASVAVDETNNYILVDAGTGVRTVTLPLASETNTFFIKKVDSSVNNVVVTANGSDTIEGSATHTLTAQYEYVNIVSDGSSTWFIFGSN